MNQRWIPAIGAVKLQLVDGITFGSETTLQAKMYETRNKEKDYVSIIQSLTRKAELLVGRSGECDYQLDSTTVSRKHCLLKKVGGDVILQDLDSTNGVFINGNKIKKETVVTGADVILIGTYKLTLGEGFKNIKDEVAVRILNLEKRFTAQKIGFQPISIDIPNQALVGIMGPSGCGKSTLLKTLAGIHSATHGDILVHGLHFVTYYEYIKTHIGYVPQDDIIHGDLTVSECLYYTARLRLPDMEVEGIYKRIHKILLQLHISDTVDQMINSLSGGQRKRVCIAVELLIEPLILFLDEPTSPLDPQSVEDLLKILQELSKQGTTIVMVTHKPEDLQYIDKVLFLAKGGIAVFFGNVSEHLSYFNASRTIDVYSILSDISSDRILQFKNKFHAAIQTASFTSSHHALTAKSNSNIVSQSYWLMIRCFRTKLNDKVNTGLLLLQAPIIACLISLIFDDITLPVLFLMSITAIWLGTNNSAREIVNEQHIYQRERLYNLNLLSYISSKLFVFLVIALVQSILFVGFLYIKFKGHQVSLDNLPEIFLWTAALTFCSSLLGLCISVLARNSEQVISTVPLVLIPQIMLAGVVTRINNMTVEVISYFTIARWGTEGFANLQNEIIAEPSTESGNNPNVIIRDAARLIAHQYHKRYYDNSVFNEWTSTFRLDGLMLGAISVVLFVTLIICLKKKDTILA